METAHVPCLARLTKENKKEMKSIITMVPCGTGKVIQYRRVKLCLHVCSKYLCKWYIVQVGVEQVGKNPIVQGNNLYDPLRGKYEQKNMCSTRAYTSPECDF